MTNIEWKGVPNAFDEEWSDLFWSEKGSMDLSAPCPVCGNRTLHRWYQILKPMEKTIQGDRYVAYGGLWQWCSSCGSYQHLSAYVPDWWSCSLIVDETQLTAEPEAIEEALQAQIQ